MDADDISYPARLKKQVEFMLKNPKVILLGTQARVIDSKGKAIGEKTVPLTHKKIYDEYGVVHPMIHPSCMFRRSLLPNKNKIYHSKFGVNGDYYSFFRLLNYGKFANLPDFLLKYRMHEKNFSLEKPKEAFINSLKIRIKAMTDYNYHISSRAMLLMIIQAIVILALTEKLIVPLYMVSRGMRQSDGLLNKSKIQMQFLFKRAYTFLFSLTLLKTLK